MGQSPSTPISSLTRAPTAPMDQKTLNAYHSEILAVAIGVLCLVSQLVLAIWLFGRRHVARSGDESHGDKEQRTIPNWTKPTITLNDDELEELDVQDAALRHRCFRRSSTWNGRAQFRTTHPGYDRRKSSGGLELADLHSTPQSSNSGADSASNSYSSELSDLRRNGGLDMAAAQAIPIRPVSPRHLRAASPLGSPGADSSDSSGFGDRIPTGLSPRSPRLVPIDHKTISMILEDEKLRRAKREPVSRVVVKEREEQELPGAFDDPLGVIRRTSVFNKENQNGSVVSLGDDNDGERLRHRGKKRSDSH